MEILKKAQKHRMLALFAVVGMTLHVAPVASTWYVAKTGKDTNSGTSASPFLTIQKAADKAQPGDKVIVKEGTYRERVTPPRGGTSESMRITYQAESGQTVVIKGSEVWRPSWTRQSGNMFYAKPDEAIFNDDVYVDNQKNPFRVKMTKPEPAAAICLGMVFVDGERYDQVLGTPTSSKSWSYSSVTGNILIHFPDANPQDHTVEIAARRTAFRPHIKGLGYITVAGFTMEHCANDPHTWIYPGNRDQHAVLDARGGHHWVVENNTVRHSNATGIDVGGYSDSYDNERSPQGSYKASYNIVRNNTVMHHGKLGIACSLKPTGRNCTITGNYVEGNNWLKHDLAEEGGIKTHNFHYSLISNNVSVYNFAHGIWVDYHWKNSRVTGNLMAGNEESDLYLEYGRTGDNILVDNNVMMGMRLKKDNLSGDYVAKVQYNFFASGTAMYGRDQGVDYDNNIHVLGPNASGDSVTLELISSGKNHMLQWHGLTEMLACKTTERDSRVVSDYFGKPMASPVKPGPFQHLITGPVRIGLAPKTGIAAYAAIAAKPLSPVTANSVQLSLSPLGTRVNACLEIPRAAHVELGLYNLVGQRVNRIFGGPMEAGRHLVPWRPIDSRGRKLSSGVYFLALRSEDGMATKRVLLRAGRMID